MERKLKPEFFKRAAERITDHQNTYCCVALENVTSYTEFKLYRDYLAKWFKPKNKRPNSPWWDTCNFDYNAKEARILALLLCAGFVRDGIK